MSSALTAEDIYDAMRLLSLPERLRLVERVVHDAADDSERPEAPVASQERQRDLDAWFGEVESLAQQIPADDFDRVEAALEEADQHAKEHVRRQMGLSG